jgi:hypothetical protein
MILELTIGELGLGRFIGVNNALPELNNDPNLFWVLFDDLLSLLSNLVSFLFNTSVLTTFSGGGDMNVVGLLLLLVETVPFKKFGDPI